MPSWSPKSLVVQCEVYSRCLQLDCDRVDPRERLWNEYVSFGNSLPTKCMIANKPQKQLKYLVALDTVFGGAK
jgi:hypothetical protein